MPRAWRSSQAWPAFLEAAQPPAALLVMLDFDGTLAPIVPRPSQARLSRTLRPLLKALVALPGVRLAVVSGRSLGQLRRKAGLSGLVLVSNHGLRCSHRGLGFPHGSLADFRRRAALAQRRLKGLDRLHPGLRLEPKGLDLSLHWRGLSEVRRRAVEAQVRRRVRGLGLRLTRGSGVLELRPAGAWDKGRAAGRLADRLSPRGACLFVGDDTTDEDAFRRLRTRARSLTLKVGAGPSLARLRIRRRELASMLKGLLGARTGGASSWN